MIRELGFYWVKFSGNWFIAQYVGSMKWLTCGNGYYFNTSEFSNIGDKIERN